ncbi:hypothetical protein BSNK01_19840 [Bacillaceae bacterium]
MIPSAPPKTATDIRLPFLFIFFGLLVLLASQGIFLFWGDPVADGVFRTPGIWMAAHLMLLGWGVMVAMGAMYQLVPVSFLVPIWSEKFGFFQFAVTATGVFGLALSFAWAPHRAYHAGGLVVLGTLMFLVQMGMTLKQRQQKQMLTLFVTTALLCLLLTVIFGALLALSIGGRLSGSGYPFYFKSHLLFGLAGWFTLLIIGFSYKLVPMFALSHGFSEKLSHWVYGVYVLGLAVTWFSFFHERFAWAFTPGVFLLWLGFSLFGFHIRQILRKKLKKKLDPGFVFALFAIATGWLVHLFAFIATLWPDFPAAGYGILLYTFVTGWISYSIAGYLFKIVPFLWWTHRYSERAGKEPVPTLKEMVNEKAGKIIFSLLITGLAGMVIFALLLQSEAAFSFFQGLLTLVHLWYGGTIVQILRK